ncbi:NAD(+) diphosphatase [Pelagibaculum spongiae]|uniref:NAD(+) diphosphatase n=1 Tax=Pelagibaculum spongiae TaxID=2080658 RepID=A0A2V1GZU7_9GAMM|nr:NAD(+) diphosphatase [Pelagibaculum spongiae]PVZ70464.1 NAD(+) diphosphatase [Pelagibaculum spongiae]
MNQANFFSRVSLDRTGEKRHNQQWLVKKLLDEKSLFYLCHGEQWLGIPEKGLVACFHQQVAKLLKHLDSWVFLGTVPCSSETDCCQEGALSKGEIAEFALDISHLDLSDSELEKLPGEWCYPRELAMVSSERQGSLLAMASTLLHWHRRHQFCGCCGNKTTLEAGGHEILCSNLDCQHKTYPRIDPSVIMLVHDQTSCLLGRQEQWQAGRFSTLAGYVEPAESLEQAVAREVMEESGIKIIDPIYHSSQPWPFPNSLMLAFTATPVSRDITLHDQELAEARWFTRQEIVDQLNSGELKLPPTIAVARQLIEDWFNQGWDTSLSNIIQSVEAEKS